MLDGRADAATRCSRSVSRSEGRRHLLDGDAAAPDVIAATARTWSSSPPTGWSWSRARRPSAAPTSTASSPPAGRLARTCARSYGQALAQRNALLRRVAAGLAPAAELDAWDGALAERPRSPLIEARAEAAAELAPRFAEAAARAWPRRGGRAALRAAQRGRRRGAARRRWRSAASPTCSAAARRSGPHLDELELDHRRPLAAPLRVAGRAARRPAGAAVRRARDPDRCRRRRRR